MSYQARIAKIVPTVDPRHVEAWMRCKHGELDGLSKEDFELSVLLAAHTALIAGADHSERLCATYGI